MDYQARNLESLIAEYRNTGKALNGFKTIKYFIDNEKEKEFNHLLRHHEAKGVYGEELIKRFEIDALLEFYNLLFIAILSGYVNSKLNISLVKEIKFVLNNKSIEQYYTKTYSYKLCYYTATYFNQDRILIFGLNENSSSIFIEFISLCRGIKKDKDIERFLGMLDYVSYGSDDIDDVIETLASAEKLNKSFTRKKKNEKDKAIWGFIKYIGFISQLKSLMQQAERNDLLQSAMWLFHGYYFQRMNTEMITIFDKAFKNIETVLQNPLSFEKISNELYGIEIEDEISISEIKEYVNEAISQSKKDVDFILKRAWFLPLDISINNFNQSNQPNVVINKQKKFNND